MQNPYFTLAESERDQMRALWSQIVHKTDDPQRHNLISVKLARNPAILSHKQLYLASIKLAQAGMDVPAFVHSYLFGQHEPVLND